MHRNPVELFMCDISQHRQKCPGTENLFARQNVAQKSGRDCQTHFIKFSNINRLEHKEPIYAKRQPTFRQDHRAGNDEFAGAGEPRVSPSISTGAVHSGGQQQADRHHKPVSAVDDLKACDHARP
jgi:hypothetical protein